MGYKSTLRSINSAINKANRESEKENKREQREYERLEKKRKDLQGKMESIIETLKDLYAKGKVNQEEYDALMKRKDDIKWNLIVFGKTSGISLAKRYICGKIDVEEFQKMQTELLPNDLIAEEQRILESVNDRQKNIQAFYSACNNEEQELCQKCGKKGNFFFRIKQLREQNLCGSCRSELENLHNYPGYNGIYFTARACEVHQKEKPQLVVQIRDEYL